MEYIVDENIKQKVLAVVNGHIGSMTCDSLQKESGLALHDLLLVLDSLMAERKISINIMPSLENGTGHFSRSEYLFIRFNRLLDEYISQERQIGFYASKLCISPKYLSGILKKVSGRTAVYWINKKLIDIVKAQLICTPKSIKEIALGLNFSTISSFGKYFKSQMSVSPTLYRRSYIEARDTR